jgi:hypothetical protein
MVATALAGLLVAAWALAGVQGAHGQTGVKRPAKPFGFAIKAPDAAASSLAERNAALQSVKTFVEQVCDRPNDFGIDARGAAPNWSAMRFALGDKGLELNTSRNPQALAKIADGVRAASGDKSRCRAQTFGNVAMLLKETPSGYTPPAASSGYKIVPAPPPPPPPPNDKTPPEPTPSPDVGPPPVHHHHLPASGTGLDQPSAPIPGASASPKAEVAFVSKVASATAAFQQITVVYNKPAVLTYQKPSLLVLSVASADLDAARARVRQGAGDVAEGAAKLGDKVRAKLAGPPGAVDISTSDPDIKVVSPSANATWSWYVTPKTTDPITLTLDIYNETTVDGATVELDGPAYADSFTVNTSWLDRIVLWGQRIKPIWLGAVAVLTALGGALVWLRNWRKKAS